MSPKSVIAGGDTEASGEVVQYSPEGRLPFEWCPQRSNASDDRNADDEEDIEPIDVLVPVLPRHWRLRDVWLLRVILLVPHGLLRCWLRLWRRL